MKNIKKSNINLLLIRNSFILLLLFFLTSCAGTGNKSLNRSELDTSRGNVKMFIYRESAFVCSGCLATVSLNARQIGKLGNNEYISSILTSNSNTLKVETTGLQGIGIKDDTKRFTKTNSNSYFLVEYDMKLFSAGWEIVEITKNEFESKF